MNIWNGADAYAVRGFDLTTKVNGASIKIFITPILIEQLSQHLGENQLGQIAMTSVFKDVKELKDEFDHEIVGVLDIKSFGTFYLLNTDKKAKMVEQFNTCLNMFRTNYELEVLVTPPYGHSPFVKQVDEATDREYIFKFKSYHSDTAMTIVNTKEKVI